MRRQVSPPSSSHASQCRGLPSRAARPPLPHPHLGWGMEGRRSFKGTGGPGLGREAQKPLARQEPRQKWSRERRRSRLFNTAAVPDGSREPKGRRVGDPVRGRREFREDDQKCPAQGEATGPAIPARLPAGATVAVDPRDRATSRQVGARIRSRSLSCFRLRLDLPSRRWPQRLLLPLWGRRERRACSVENTRLDSATGQPIDVRGRVRPARADHGWKPLARARGAQHPPCLGRGPSPAALRLARGAPEAVHAVSEDTVFVCSGHSAAAA